MKMYFNFATVSLSLALLLMACSKEDDPILKSPIISHFEYGAGITHSSVPVGYKGSDLHLEADIEAEAVVREITIDIHAHDATPSDEEVEWNFHQSFEDPKYQVKNPVFHEHIQIPENIPSGEYHIALTVTDEMGNISEQEGELEILDPVQINDVEIADSVVRGAEIHAEFSIHAIHGIHKVSVDIHSHGLIPGDGEMEWTYEHEFTGDYHGETEVVFHEHIDVPITAPAGEYHVLFIVEDEKGNSKTYDTYTEVINN